MLFALGLSLALSVPGGVANLHPTFSAKVEQLMQRSARAGVRLKLISGYRRMDQHRARTQGRASWHNFGLAIDVNLAKRGDMPDALRNYQRDANDWRTVARIGKEVGLIWGGDWAREEIFHFEWHPGAPAAIRKDTLDSLLAEAGQDGRHFKRTWHRFGGAAPAVVRRPDERRGTRKGNAKGKRKGRKTQVAKADKRVRSPKARRGGSKRTAKANKRVRTPKARGRKVRQVAKADKRVTRRKRRGGG